MATADLVDWLAEFSGDNAFWYVKRLSGNDTLANRTHQAGPYIPKKLLFGIFPVLNRPEIKDPDVRFDLYVDSHPDHRVVRAVWYNNKTRGGTRDEARLTNFGGRGSALLAPENTGALTVFAFRLDSSGAAIDCHVWVCRDRTEEELVEDRIGPVEPGKGTVWSAELSPVPNRFAPLPRTRRNCWLTPDEIPAEWLLRFPTGAEIVHKAVELRSDRRLPPDRRLIRRRDCEFEIFRSVEQAVELPLITRGFVTIDDFIARAQTILQRRKARSGRSLELHAREIFIEEGLREGQAFEHQPVSDPGKRPDFLFPSASAYRDPGFPDDSLRMLAVKTTCRDRWRQILNEADRIRQKHLLTLQEGVSESQFREMSEAGVRLVVPASLVGSYPKAVRPRLQTLENFIQEIRQLPVHEAGG